MKKQMILLISYWKTDIVSEDIQRILADLIRFVEPSATDSNKRRWKKSIWWEDFLEGIEPIQLKGKEYQPNLAKTLNWVEKAP